MNKVFELPILYKKTSTGAIQFWQVGVDPCTGTGDDIPSEIATSYGQVGTDKVQTTYDVISEGKNTGKKNATTAHEQAVSEAKSRWEKKKKSGYVETPSRALNDETDDLIEGGIVPMLAQSFSKHGHKIKYPCATQPKLDGIRCIAIMRDGKCTLWSRTRKPITSMPHIVQKVEEIFKDDIVLDGELYNHSFKDDFEKIVSAVRKESPEDGYLNVQYHIYDVVNEDDFSDRNTTLSVPLGREAIGPLVFVSTHWVTEESQVMEYFNRFKSEGYEGAMLRNVKSKYVNKRSYDLQKVKEFDDAEFKIVNVEEGRGKLAGHVGAFVCRTADGKEFLAKMSGETSNLKKYFEDHSLWKGKLLTVQYQGLTGREGVPRFPVGLRFREE